MRAVVLLLFGLGCVSTPLREPSDSPGVDASAGTDSGPGSSCQISPDGSCSPGSPDLLCCPIRGYRGDPGRRCSGPAGGTHPTYACVAVPNGDHDRACDTPGGGGCYVRRSAGGAIVEILTLQIVLGPSDLAAWGVEECDAATVADLATYSVCGP